MLRKTILPLIALLTLIYGSQTLTAQNTTSPYSKYGYGLLRDNANIAQRQMGYTGYAMTSGKEVNMMNPASYAAVDTLTFLFDMGLDLSFISSSDADAKRDEQGGGLDYISMLFPVAKNMGVSIGLVPYSSVGYAFGTDIDNGLYTRQGNGGINQLYAGYAIRPFKGFSIGANVSYLFGNTQNVIYAYTTTGSTSAFAQTIDIRDWNIQAYNTPFASTPTTHSPPPSHTPPAKHSSATPQSPNKTSHPASTNSQTHSHTYHCATTSQSPTNGAQDSTTDTKTDSR